MNEGLSREEKIKEELADFMKKEHHVDDELDFHRFLEKWKMLLKWQNSGPVMTGTLPEIEDHKKHFRDVHILTDIPPQQYPKILDLGCGAGEPEALNQLGYNDVLGYTLGPLNIVYGKEKYGSDIRYGDMHDLPFKEGTFDAVITKHSFEHCFIPILVAIEIWHVLRVGGKWFLVQPNIRNDAGCHWGHPTVLNAQQRANLFNHFGFKILYNDEENSLCEKMAKEEIKQTKYSACLEIFERRKKMDEI